MTLRGSRGAAQTRGRESGPGAAPPLAQAPGGSRRATSGRRAPRPRRHARAPPSPHSAHPPAPLAADLRAPATRTCGAFRLSASVLPCARLRRTDPRPPAPTLRSCFHEVSFWDCPMGGRAVSHARGLLRAVLNSADVRGSVERSACTAVVLQCCWGNATRCTRSLPRFELFERPSAIDRIKSRPAVCAAAGLIVSAVETRAAAIDLSEVLFSFSFAPGAVGLHARKG